MRISDCSWVVVDTETTGFTKPIFVVEIGAQRMKGCLPDGPPFRRIINHGTDIPPEASRVNGYTREILERDGDAPTDVYVDFGRYVNGLPVSAYNLKYDWDEVLLPEWERLGLNVLGQKGLCLLKLTQRLLDPVPAGNFKLQTLRQYYKLPERGAHTALGDVETVVDFFQSVLVPLIKSRGLAGWQELVEFSEEEWYPSKIPFGKFKGRFFSDAKSDERLRAWLEWLAASKNQRSAQMGAWYLSQLDNGFAYSESENVFTGVFTTGFELVNGAFSEIELRRLIAVVRDRLADLQVTYTRDQSSVSATKAKIFEILRPLYEKRDLLKLRLRFRQQFLDALLISGEEEALSVDERWEHAKQSAEYEYEQTASAFAGKGELSQDQEVELKTLWRELVRLFHPDRFMDDDDKRAAYQRLTAEINSARDSGDIERMREIAKDPEGVIRKLGLAELHLEEEDSLVQLKQLYDELQEQVVSLIEATDNLYASPDWDLHQLVTQKEGFLEELVQERTLGMETEVEELTRNLEDLEQQIADLMA